MKLVQVFHLQRKGFQVEIAASVLVNIEVCKLIQAHSGFRGEAGISVKKKTLTAAASYYCPDIYSFTLQFSTTESMQVLLGCCCLPVCIIHFFWWWGVSCMGHQPALSTVLCINWLYSGMAAILCQRDPVEKAWLRVQWRSVPCRLLCLCLPLCSVTGSSANRR